MLSLTRCTMANHSLSAQSHPTTSPNPPFRGAAGPQFRAHETLPQARGEAPPQFRAATQPQVQAESHPPR